MRHSMLTPARLLLSACVVGGTAAYVALACDVPCMQHDLCKVDNPGICIYEGANHYTHCVVVDENATGVKDWAPNTPPVPDPAKGKASDSYCGVKKWGADATHCETNATTQPCSGHLYVNGACDD